MKARVFLVGCMVSFAFGTLFAQNPAPAKLTRPKVATDPAEKALIDDLALANCIFASKDFLDPFFNISSIPLRPAFNGGVFIGDGLPSFDLRKSIVSTPELGHERAKELIAKPAILLNTHGAVLEMQGFFDAESIVVVHNRIAAEPGAQNETMSMKEISTPGPLAQLRVPANWTFKDDPSVSRLQVSVPASWAERR